MGLMFYPRGGSAQVARYLSRALDAEGWPVSLLSGSLGAAGERTHAASFYDDPGVRAVDYSPALLAYEQGRDPIAEPVPFHPSFEDQLGVPDRVFCAVEPRLGDHLAAAWERAMSGWAETAAVTHLHHLSPLQEAARRLRPERPLLTHLHGTELKMIDRIGRLTEIARLLGEDLERMARRAREGALPAPDHLDESQRDLFERTHWPSWRYGAHWARRLRAGAALSDGFVVISPHDRDEAHRLLGVDEADVEWIPNGVDVARFDRRKLSARERLARWRHWLVEEPRGWDRSGEPGSVRYRDEQLGPFGSSRDGEPPAPVLLYVGRFLGFKRVPLLLRAYARARPRLDRPAPLVVWGGFPGEWEGEHPVEVARELGVEGVFFTGWRGHDDLPEGLACADVLVAPSNNEPFGQVYLEAMACGLPVIGTRSGGPTSFVNTTPQEPNGWLVETDDLDALTDAIVEAVNDGAARRARAANAYRQIRRDYSWARLANRFVAAYERLASTRAS